MRKDLELLISAVFSFLEVILMNIILRNPNCCQNSVQGRFCMCTRVCMYVDGEDTEKIMKGGTLVYSLQGVISFNCCRVCSNQTYQIHVLNLEFWQELSLLFISSSFLPSIYHVQFSCIFLLRTPDLHLFFLD